MSSEDTENTADIDEERQDYVENIDKAVEDYNTGEKDKEEFIDEVDHLTGAKMANDIEDLGERRRRKIKIYILAALNVIFLIFLIWVLATN